MAAQNNVLAQATAVANPVLVRTSAPTKSRKIGVAKANRTGSVPARTRVIKASKYRGMAITFQQFSKDPDAVLDYVVDWTAWLTPISDTISAVQWTVATGLTMTAQINSSKTATIWLSGGTVNKTYLVTCRITTTGGRREDQSFNIFIENH
jgi:hypothetical protein